MFSINAQNKIAKILQKYDDLIEKNNRKIAIIEEQIQELYREWFVRFRFPGYKKAEFVSGVPKDWKYTKFSEICNYERGISYSSEQIESDNAKYLLINLKNIKDYGGFRKDNYKTYNGTVKESQIVKYMDLVII